MWQTQSAAACRIAVRRGLVRAAVDMALARARSSGIVTTVPAMHTPRSQSTPNPALGGQAAVLEGFAECFNAGRYYEAHDVLEPLWLEARGSPKADFLQGLIQVAGAFVHVRQSRLEPALRLLRSAERRLAAYPTGCDGVDLGQVRQLIRDWLEALPGADGSRPLLELGLAPRIEVPLAERGAATAGVSEPIDEAAVPALLETEAELEEQLTRPRRVLVDFIRSVRSPLVILGAGGKMGPTLAVLARRAAQAAGHPLQIVAVSRFSDPVARGWLEARGIATVACDLLDRDALGDLPDTTNLIYLVGLKFGTTEDPAATWAANALVPTHVVARFPAARMVALSTGNVYPLVPIVSGGATEESPLTPVGEYANAAVARERLFEFCARRHGTPVALLRLNYAVELRYGVLLDLARKVWTGEPIDLTQGFFNCIWQGDANEFILRALAVAQHPPLALNLTGPGVLSVRDLAGRLGEWLERRPHLVGTEAETALLSDAARAWDRLGWPPTPLEAVLRWTAHWVRSGGRTLNRPTHFEVRDGKY